MRYRRVKAPGATYFFTLVMRDRQPIFDDPRCVDLFADANSAVNLRHPFEVEAQVILPDHLHAMWTLTEGDAAYSRRWRLIKETFTRSYIKMRGPLIRSTVAKARGEQPVWQRRFWEHLIHDEQDFASHLDYIHYNPVKHGLAAAPRDWPNSTFRNWVNRGAYDAEWGMDVVPPYLDRLHRSE